MEKVERLNRVSCLWCDNHFYYPATEKGYREFRVAMANHLVECKRHPLVRAIKDLLAEKKQIIKTVDYIYEIYKKKCRGEKCTVKQIGKVHKLAKQALKDK